VTCVYLSPRAIAAFALISEARYACDRSHVDEGCLIRIVENRVNGCAGFFRASLLSSAVTALLIHSCIAAMLLRVLFSSHVRSV